MSKIISRSFEITHAGNTVHQGNKTVDVLDVINGVLSAILKLILIWLALTVLTTLRADDTTVVDSAASTASPIENKEKAN